MRREGLGTLAVGSAGDATVMEVRDEIMEHTDVSGEKLLGDTRLVSAGTVIGGNWWCDGVSD